MITDTRTLAKMQNFSALSINNKTLEEFGFEPGESVHVIFEEGKVTIVKDIEPFILEKAKECGCVKE